MANGNNPSRLSLLGQGLARGNPLLDIGLGLLQAAGPSRTPVSLGQALASGLSFAQSRDIERTRNQSIRDELARAKSQRAALEELLTSQRPEPGAGQGFGVLRPDILEQRLSEPSPLQSLQAGQPTQRAIQLLGKAAPEQFIEGLLGRVGEQAETSAEAQKLAALRAELDREPTEREKLAVFGVAPKATGFETTKEFALGFSPAEARALTVQKAQGANIQPQLQELSLRQKQLEIEQRSQQIAQVAAERETAQLTKSQQRTELRDSIQNDLAKARETSQLVDSLEDTSLETGVASEFRESIVGGAALIGGAIGVDVSKQKEALSNAQRLRQNAVDFGVKTLIDLKGTGAISQRKFDSLMASTISAGNSPGANRKALADILDTVVQGAERNNIKIPNRGEVDSLRKQLRRKREQQAQGSLSAIDRGQSRARRERVTVNKPLSEMTDAELRALLGQ